MATRPVFVPASRDYPFVDVIEVEFEWFPGFAKSQAQKSIDAQHREAKKRGLFPILEVSSRSDKPLGVDLSAFNLAFRPQGERKMSVECAFQGSKVFENGGPFTELYFGESRAAKTDERIRNSGRLVAFEFLGERFPVTPVTAFYDWLYITALWQNPVLYNQIREYRGFSDIAFNPKRSVNCQARSAALFVSLRRSGYIERVMSEKAIFFSLVGGGPPPNGNSGDPQKDQLRLQL